MSRLEAWPQNLSYVRQRLSDRFVESLLEQLRNRVRAFLRLLAFGPHRYGRAHRRREHQHAHDALRIDRLTVLHEGHEIGRASCRGRGRISLRDRVAMTTRPRSG